MRHRRMVTFTVCAAATLALVQGPASATQPAAGALAVEGEAFLPNFPCTAGCTGGEFEGTATGSVGGLAGGIPWSAHIVQAPVSASFSYNDNCTQIGSATGDAQITASLGRIYGTYGPVPGDDEIPVPVVALTITSAFSWTRAGLNADVDLSNFDARLTIVKEGALGPELQQVDVIVDHAQQALATFVPLEVPGCGLGTTLGPPLTAAVAVALPVN